MTDSKTRILPRSAPKNGAKRAVDSFRNRFDKIEAQRIALLARLANVAPEARKLPAYRNVSKLLGPSFIKSALVKRVAVLQAAEWLLNILETIAIL